MTEMDARPLTIKTKIINCAREYREKAIAVNRDAAKATSIVTLQDTIFAKYTRLHSGAMGLFFAANMNGSSTAPMASDFNASFPSL